MRLGRVALMTSQGFLWRLRATGTNSPWGWGFPPQGTMLAEGKGAGEGSRGLGKAT